MFSHRVEITAWYSPATTPRLYAREAVHQTLDTGSRSLQWYPPCQHEKATPGTPRGATASSEGGHLAEDYIAIARRATGTPRRRPKSQSVGALSAGLPPPGTPRREGPHSTREMERTPTPVSDSC